MAQDNDPELGFPLKGSLRRNPFPKLVRNIAKAQASGSLYLLSDQTKKVVSFEQGQPVFVRSNVLAECLGQILTQEGLITQEQCDRTLEEIRSTGRRQGELLMEKGILSEGNLRYGLETQLRRKFFEIFSWEEGRYQYKAGGDGVEHGPRLAMRSPALILAALLEVGVEERADQALRTVGDRFAFTDDDLDVDALDLLPEEALYTRGLDGSRSVDQLLQAAASASVPAPKTLLYGLIQAGFAKLLKDPRAARPALPPLEDLRGHPDAEFLAAYEATHSLSDLEDTPLPGQLPRRELGAADEAVFQDVDETESGHRELPVHDDSRAIAGIETDAIDETFEEEIEVIDEAVLELVDEDYGGDGEGEVGAGFSADTLSVLAREADELGREEVHELAHEQAREQGRDLYDDGEEEQAPGPAPAPVDEGDEDLALDDDLALDVDDDLLLAGGELDDTEFADETGAPAATQPAEHGPPGDLGDLDDLGDLGDLGDLDDLDSVELGGGLPAGELEGHARSGGATAYSGAEATAPTDVGDDAEMRAAMSFSEGEMALSLGDWAEAVGHLEAAFAAGFEVAELHAMLAYARFRESNNSTEMAAHAIELLDYAAELNPKLDIIWAYRAAILLDSGDEEGARAAAEAALAINEYCDVAMEVLDRLG